MQQTFLYTPKAMVIDNHLPRQPLISSYVPDWPLPPRVYIPSESEMALRARIYAYNRHLSFDVAFICSTLTHCGVCHLSVWRLKWEVSYVHQSVWRWKWFFCQSNYVLQRQNVRYCFPTGNRFTAAVGLWNMLWWYSFPTAKECNLPHPCCKHIQTCPYLHISTVSSWWDWASVSSITDGKYIPE